MKGAINACLSALSSNRLPIAREAHNPIGGALWISQNISFLLALTHEQADKTLRRGI